MAIKTEVSASAATALARLPPSTPRVATIPASAMIRSRTSRIIGEHQHVAVNLFAAVELLGADVVESCGDAHLRTKHALRDRGGRTRRRQLNDGHLRRNQRHNGVDQDLAIHRRLDVFEGRVVIGIGYAENDDVGRLRRSTVVVSAHGTVGLTRQLLGLGLRSLLRPRPNDDGIAGRRPQLRQA